MSKSPFDLSTPSTLFSKREIHYASRDPIQSRVVDAMRASGIEPCRIDCSRTSQATQDKRNSLVGKSFP